MTNEEFQKLVLEKLTQLSSDMITVKDRLGNVENRLVDVEGRLGNVENRLVNVEGRLENIEGQLIETNQIVKVLLHRTEELDAKFDGLLQTTATKDALTNLENKIITQLDRMAGDITYLVRKTAEHDDDIRALRRAK